MQCKKSLGRRKVQKVRLQSAETKEKGSQEMITLFLKRKGLSPQKNYDGQPFLREQAQGYCAQLSLKVEEVKK